jgi:hypothetical protein
MRFETWDVDVDASWRIEQLGNPSYFLRVSWWESRGGIRTKGAVLKVGLVSSFACTVLNQVWTVVVIYEQKAVGVGIEDSTGHAVSSFGQEHKDL